MSIHDGRAIVLPERGDIGYAVILPVKHFCKLHGNEAFWIWHAISQDDQRLYAFYTAPERWFAELVATTQRIGPGTAHRVVTTLGVEPLKEMIQRGDEAGLAKAIKGLGAKGASSIIANLRGRLGDVVAGTDTRVRTTVEALKALGVVASQAEVAFLETTCRENTQLTPAQLSSLVVMQRSA